MVSLLRYSLTLCFLLFLASNVQANPIPDLVAHYPLDGNGNDYSGNGNHASTVSASAATDRFNRPNSCYVFNGTSQYIEIPDNNLISIPTTGQLTISVWMRPDVLDFSTGGDYIHWMGKGVSGQHEYVLRMYNKNSIRPNRTSCYSYNLSGGLGAGSYVQEVVTPGQWIHIVALYNFPTNTIQLYKNGVLKDTDTFTSYSISPGNGTAPLRLGTRDFINYFEGAIDDLKIFDRALNQTEIDILFNEAPVVPDPEVTCNLSVFLEGPYDASNESMNTTLRQAGQLPNLQPYHHSDWGYLGSEQVTNPPAGMVDWVLISFRESLTSGCIARKAAILLQDGTVESFNVSIPSGLSSVYVMVEHRNHLPIITDQPVPIVNETLTFDFTQTPGYSGTGSGQKRLGNNWALFAGNGSQDGATGYDLNALDRSYWALTNGSFGLYHPADYNMDNDVSAGDRILWGINNGTFSGVTKLECLDTLITEPLLICPPSNFVLDNCNYTVSWSHNNPTSTTVNYDLRINGVDPGLSVMYPISSNTIDICSALGISSGTGTLNIELLYWYDGDLTNIVSAGTCVVNYDFTPSGGNGDLVTCDNSRLALAAPYEALFHTNLPRLMTTLRNFGVSQSDTHWQNNGGYCGVTGVKMYHYKAAIESITRMLLYADAVGQTSHVQDYEDSLWEILDDIMPKFISGNGTAGTSSTSDYSCGANRNPTVTRHRYLDASRTMAWAGYAVCALVEVGVTSAEQAKIDAWAISIKPAIAAYMNNMDGHCQPSNGGFSHMCLHSLTGAYLWSNIGGYTDFNSHISSNLTSVLNAYQATSGDLGSDIGHDTDAMSNISIVRDKQTLTGQPTGPLVTEAMLKLIGDRVAIRINSGEAWPGATGLTPGYEHLFALTVGFSTSMDNLVAPATNANYPSLSAGSSSSHVILNHFVSVASAAWGYAMKGDNENCP